MKRNGWGDSTTHHYCPGCKTDRMLRLFVDRTDAENQRYWICRACWTHIPIQKGAA